MRYPAYFSPVIKIVLWIIAALSIAAVAVGIAFFAGAQIPISTGQATLLISVFSLTTIVAILLATIHYKASAEHLRMNIAFVDILGGRIRFDKILNIVIDGNKMYISYIWKGPDPVIAALMIAPKRFEEMKNLLMSKNPKIVLYRTKKDETTDSEQQ